MSDPRNILPEFLDDPSAMSREEAEREVERFFQRLETELKDIPKELVEVGAERVLDFLKGELSWAEIFCIPPETVQRIAEFGYLQYQAGRMEEAERFFKVLTMLNWNNSAFHAMLGMVYRHQRRPGEAIVEFTQALESDPHDLVSLSHRAQLYLQHGWLEPARADLETMAQHAPAEDQALQKRVEALRARLEELLRARQGGAPAGGTGGSGSVPVGGMPAGGPTSPSAQAGVRGTPKGKR